MPKELPIPDHIWSERVRFFSIDTDVLQRHRFQFRSGALGHLPQQLPETMELLLPEIVQCEMIAHYEGAVCKAVAELQSSIKAVNRASTVDITMIEQAVSEADIANRSLKDFRSEVHEFVSRCGGRILSLSNIDAASLFRDYFSLRPPFEERKKSEFPDAASLQLLQQYAEEHDTMGIIVSGDGGWQQFARESDRLYCFKSIEELTTLFAATGRSVDDVKKRIASVINQPESPITTSIIDAIRNHVRDAEWDTSSFVPDIGDRLEAGIYDATVTNIEIAENIEVWLDEHGDEHDSSWVMELTGHVTVLLEGSAQSFKWDGIDREFVKLATEPLRLTEEIDVTIYLTLRGVRLNTEPAEWQVDVDIASAQYHLGWREVSLDS